MSHHVPSLEILNPHVASGTQVDFELSISDANHSDEFTVYFACIGEVFTDVPSLLAENITDQPSVLTFIPVLYPESPPTPDGGDGGDTDSHHAHVVVMVPAVVDGRAVCEYGLVTVTKGLDGEARAVASMAAQEDRHLKIGSETEAK